MTTIEKDLGVSVGDTDELMDAIAAAQARIKEVYASGQRSFISRIPDAEWKTWHEVDEKCLVQDPCGLGPDPLDDDEEASRNAA
ncbi:hypothetical protein [Salinarimonas ramus]|uniref:Uncharacterized protein n=1 Tax=Salinarimonas ramus TaxID=690164 RepID=A0A917Q5P3_9HYPH|nr:hypothetical protein [Salinarimonas ramus]GGK29847.1 hypothetical protein GCM10011322_15380 [Salinarimonas ramus]